MSISSYARIQEVTEAPRTTEYRALALVTGKLIETKKNRDREFVEACFLNRKLWTLFQNDLALPENGLPEALKAQLISLSIWVQKQTGPVMRGTASVDALIDVNTAIMAGLSPSAANDVDSMAAASA